MGAYLEYFSKQKDTKQEANLIQKYENDVSNRAFTRICKPVDTKQEANLTQKTYKSDVSNNIKNNEEYEEYEELNKVNNF